MKKNIKKFYQQRKQNNQNSQNNEIISVQNVEGEENTTAEVIIRNKINYTPKVSVIIPVYNVEEYLRQCLDSVINQTLKEIEIICVDDGSTDNSLEILKEYAQKDKRITILKQENLHAGVARNAGLAVAKGEYVHFLDSDDWVDLESLKKLYEIAVSKKIDVLKFRNKIYDNKEKKVSESHWVNMDSFPDEYVGKILDIKTTPVVIKLPDSPWSGIYKLLYLKKEKIYFDSLICANDTSFFIEAVSKGSVYVCKDISLVTYRVNNDKSLVGIRCKNFSCQLSLWQNINKRITHLPTELIIQINARTLAGIGYKIDEYFTQNLNAEIKETIFQQTKTFFEQTNIDNIITFNKAFIYDPQKALQIREAMLYSDTHIDYMKNKNYCKKQCYTLRKCKANSNIKISVIMPVYNAEVYLRQCLDRVINQTLKEIEIICVDDGSTDKSLEILKEYAQKDNRITILIEKNSGPAVAKNNCMNVAKGEFIAIMDSDDLYPSSDTLEYMYLKAKKYNALICGGSLNQIKDGKLVDNPSQFDKGYTFDKNGFMDYKEYQFDYGYWRFIYNRQFLRNNNIWFPEYLRFEDPVFFVKAMALAKKFYALKQVTYVYRVEYKEIKWTLPMAKDVVKGITDCLELSRKYELNKLHYQYGKKKLWSNWLTKNVYDSLEINDFLLIKMLNSVDMKLMKKMDPTYTLPIYKNIKRKPISIIIPVYNVEKYLSECLDSTINQTLKDIEIICVNDGSTDNSLEILQEYASKDERITIINQKNQGLSCSRNNAMKIAKGEYILFLDSDDWIRKDTCELLYTKAKKHNADMVNFAGTNYDDNSKILTQLSGQRISYVPENKDYFSREELETFMYNIPISACRFFYRRAFLEENKITFPEGINFEDNYFVREALIFTQIYGVEREILYFRRVHGESITQNMAKFFGDYIEVISRVGNLYEQKHIQKDVTKKIMQTYCDYLYEKYNSFRKEDRIKYREPLFDFLRKVQKKYGFYNEKFNKNCNTYKNQLEQWWFKIKKTRLNLCNPKTFNEKIQWLKLYDSTPIKTRLADKYLVRDWVKETIGEEYLIPLLGVYDKFEDIDFDKLPNQFVIKCNHGCGYNIIVKDKSKLDLEEVKSKLNKWMNENFAFKAGFELQYRDIKPKIIIEKFIENEGTNDLYDYKFWCFGGKVKYIQFLSERNLDGLKMAFYDKEWHKQKFVYDHPLDTKTIEKPDNLDLMIKLAEYLARDFNYVRVDFYRLNDGKIYFGEMTFTSASGSCGWSDANINKYFGSLIKLPKRAYDIDTGKYYKPPRRSMLKICLLFPYYLMCWVKQKIKSLNWQIKEIEQSFRIMRIDIKNLGSEDNNTIVTAENSKISQPTWFTNGQGIGTVAEIPAYTAKLSVQIIKDGTLRFDFRGQDKRNSKGVRLPVWIDYKSIKIDGKEILQKPVETWHDKPYRYEMEVKNGQTVNVEIKQIPHQYERGDLRVLIKVFYPNLSDLDSISKIVHRKFDHRRSLSYQLFHKKTTKNYEKTYLCGVQVWKKKINKGPSIESRFAELSSKIEKMQSNMETHQKDLLSKINERTTPYTSTKIEEVLVQMSKEIEKVQSEVRALRNELIQKINEQQSLINNLESSQIGQSHIVQTKTAKLIQKQKDFVEKQTDQIKEELISMLDFNAKEAAKNIVATQNVANEALNGISKVLEEQAKITQNLENLKDNQEENLKSFFEQMKQYYVSRTKTDNYNLEFRTFADLAHCIRQNLNKLPQDADLVVGIPRSGMIPAYIIALFMNKKCCSLDEFLSGMVGSNGTRAIKDTKIKKVLVVDDSVFSGNEMNRVKEKLEVYTDQYDFIYTTIYMNPESKDKVDIWFEEVQMPRVWQWNYLNHSIAEKACFDMDGVLCKDPANEENDDGEKYVDFIKNAKPLYVPTYEIHTIVTSRLEKYRAQTKKWLKQNGVKYKNLVMLDLASGEERRQTNCHAKFKAETYKNLPETVLFVESDPKQAREIALLSGKTVICVANDEVY